MVRKASRNDIAQLKKLLREFMVDYNRKKVLKGLQYDYMQFKNIDKVIAKTAKKYCNFKSKKKKVFVYEKKGKLLGYIFGEVYKNNDRIITNIGHVEEWFVSKKYRGQNIGKELWNKLMIFFKDNNVQVIKLEVFSQNKPAFRLYKNMGFKTLDKTLIKKLD